MALRYEVVPACRWRSTDGRTASVYGAVPWTSEAERPLWSVERTGWTVRNPITLETGIGRAPCATREEAEALALKLGRPSPIGIGG
jgi:hypothetical protein